MLNEFGIFEEVVLKLLQQIILGRLVDGNQAAKTKIVHAVLVVFHKSQHLHNTLSSLFVKYALDANLCIGIHTAILSNAFRLQFFKVAIIIYSERGDIEPARLKLVLMFRKQLCLLTTSTTSPT